MRRQTTVTEQLSVHARFVDEEGKLCSRFLKIIDLLQPEIESLDSAVEATRISAGAETVKKEFSTSSTFTLWREVKLSELERTGHP